MLISLSLISSLTICSIDIDIGLFYNPTGFGRLHSFAQFYIGKCTDVDIEVSSYISITSFICIYI